MVHKFIPMPQAMNILAAKDAVDKELKKLETIPAWNVELGLAYAVFAEQSSSASQMTAKDNSMKL